MKNILSMAVASSFIAGMVISTSSAESVLCVDGNKTNTSTAKDKNISVDIKGQGTDINMTFVPNINGSAGSGFRVVFTNGGFAERASITLCSNGQRVGNMFSKGTGGTDGIMEQPRFQFDSDVNESLIVADSNITFHTTDDCTTLPQIVSNAATCSTVSAKVDDGKTTQGTAFPDYNTNSLEIAQTVQMIRIACTAPECFVTGDKLKFTNDAKAAGVNVALTDPSTGKKPTSGIYSTADCPECGEEAIVKCTTDILIENKSTDFNITGLDIVAAFHNGTAIQNSAFKPTIDISVDGNESKAYTLGSKFSPANLNIGADSNSTIRLTFTPDTTTEIATGAIWASVTGLDSNLSSAGNDVQTVFNSHPIASIRKGAETKFTVPYMNGKSPNFVKIATTVDSETPLAAEVTDSKGNKCNVELQPIVANGSTFVFAGTAPSGDEYQTLVPAGQCSNLVDSLYSVVFTTNAQVNVVSYMRTSVGERYVDVY
jgi:hypothetical protein